MRGYFSFEWETPGDDGFVDLVLLFLKTDAEADSNNLAQALQDQLETRRNPDRIYILCPNPLFSSEMGVVGETVVAESLTRGNQDRPTLLLGFDTYGNITQSKQLLNHDEFNVERAVAAFNHSYLTVSRMGFGELLSADPKIRVEIPAPPGYVFSKPSSRSSNYFIRAENILVSPEALGFICFCLLRPFGEWLLASRREPQEIRTIVIDTMGIAALAITFGELVCLLSGTKDRPRVESFGSYANLQRYQFPVDGTYFTLISASATGSLSTEVVIASNCHPKSCVVILSYVQSEVERPVLHSLSLKEEFRSYSAEDDLGGYKEIRVVGEQFLFEVAPPKCIDIGNPHRPTGIVEKLQQLFEIPDAFSCQGSVSGSSGHRYPVFVIKDRMTTNENLRDWVKTQLKHIVPASIEHIVYSPDGESLAGFCYDVLRQEFGASKIQVPVPSETLVERAKFRGSVLIVSLVVTKGSALLHISQDLREVQESGGRVYLNGLAFPESEASYKFLKSNLETGPEPYRFASWIIAPIGRRGGSDPWETERRLLNSLPPHMIRDNVKIRLDVLAGGVNGIDGPLFLPSSKDGSELRATAGFEFWPKKHPIGRQGQLMFLTIRWVLQQARSLPANHDRALSKGSFQQVVISPETFGRFNDGIIQAALLRAAEESELDYSGSPELSERMTNWISQLVGGWKRTRGEAVFEYAFALASGRLKVCRNDKQQLLERFQSAQIPNELLDAFVWSIENPA